MAAGSRKPERVPRRNGENSAPAPMSVTVKNFGPISSGTVSLRPLTILIGPSNSGKSYMARLLYRMARSFQALGGGFDIPLDAFMRLGDTGTGASTYMSALSDTRSLSKKLSHAHAVAIPKNTQMRILETMMSPFPNLFGKELRREFQSDLGKLVRFSATGFSISISGSIRASLEWPVNSRVTRQILPDARYWAVRDHDSGDVSLRIEASGKSSVFPLPTRAAHFVMGNSEFEESIARDLVNILMSKLRELAMPHDTRTFFFSLSASPLAGLSGYPVGIPDSAGHSPDADLGNFSVPGLPEGFIQFMLSIEPGRPGPLGELANSMELDLFGGNIALAKSAHDGIPAISLSTTGGNVPLRLASSHVSSMALLTIYIRYLIAPGDRIIIEEPEAHMHPANQLTFAKYVALLIRQGVNVTLVTHSVLIFERLSAYMMLGSLDRASRKKAARDPEIYLALDEISAHEFIARRNGHYTIREIPGSGHDGLEQDEFGKLRFNMYQERLSLQQKIEEFADDQE